MRLIGNFGLFYKILFVEAAILFLIGAVFYSQFSKAKANVVRETIAASRVIGDDAAEFAVYTQAPTSKEFYSFLRSKHGQAGVLNTFTVTPSSFGVAFMRETGETGFRGSLYSPKKGYGVVDGGGTYSVTVPFLMGADGNPYGVITINSSKTLIMKKVLRDNILLYLALFVVLNNQVFILHYFTQKRQKDIIDKGYTRPYMKQHSIGALKVMRKILEEIIEDHPEERKTNNPAAEAPQDGKKAGGKKIISISKFISKNS
ncbi:MAG: hypothetical protein ACR2NQ_02385 [Thermodesulfobacteriota bacterium]